GAGKTNLLEAVHLAAQGVSFRTRQDAQIVRHGADAGLARVAGARRGAAVTAEVQLSDREPKRIRWNGTAVGSAEELRSRIHALAFTPDRLAVVKGGPALRRASCDRVVARVLPARADVPTAYAAALGQRNAGLPRGASRICADAAPESV